ncbi:hypothetical protein B0I35DRAFT_408602 [Stachybotrys elegans]|uniref:Rad4 beta-hairpin domain-containing protein n=1 Tax=Stachybotrys elegans TaxID=80388 RepID=A0A8K0SSM9_9HYPO|nr:hypothetical protein B0I35DRAFT_408602 [Stachybotrys elegans]
MPPHVPRKRLRKSPPASDAKDQNALKASKSDSSASGATRRKATLYDDLDASATPQSGSILDQLQQNDSDSSLTSLSDEDFEDVPAPKRQKTQVASDDDDDDIEFEDVAAPTLPAPDAPVTSGDLELTLNRDTRMSLTNSYGDKKGATKRERMVRNATHCVHVMCLMWHNAVRNSWISDSEVQAIMLSHLPPRLWDEVERWRRNSGLEKPPASQPDTTKKGRRKGKAKDPNARESRDWGSAAERLEEGKVDMSHGDPLFRLMQSLVPWWKQRFRVRTPGLRKLGYMPLERLDRITKAYKGGADDPRIFGERIASLSDFRKCAQDCRGSRDLGAQLFTSLLRALGLEARLVANLQCLGFGWSKLEDADPETDAQAKALAEQMPDCNKGTKNPQVVQDSSLPSNQATSRPRKSATTRGNTKSVETDSLELEYKDTDDESVIELDVTPKKPQPSATKIDNDLEYPHYWTEVMSPVSKKWLPVDPIVKGFAATNRDLVESLEPRGAKADRARQVIAYIIGFSNDGTAKDVTVRYLKKQLFPGRTKGLRMPPEKVPIYNHHGKIKRYDMFDWFKSAMSGYRRGTRQHPLTEVDEEEDSTDLKPRQPEKKEVKEGEETLQYYKQSKEFVLARHLKREEALKPDASAVKIFKNKVKGNKIENEDVFLRSDVLQVKSAETWHKQGRAPIPGEQPLKRVPYRAATLNRRREILEAEAATGEKVLQGLYSFEQTEWIIPPPIQNGIIPKNEYGNIDLFVEHMCPQGAVHVPYRGAMRVCKRLQIDYAEAVVDFEFGHRMAVPVIQGVVIAEEYHDRVMEELEKDEAEKRRKEDEKRRKVALGHWRKFLMGMRIVERIRQEYGEVDESISVFAHSKGSASRLEREKDNDKDGEMAGGFLPEGYEHEEEADEPLHQTSSFFPVVDEDDADAPEDDLIMEDHQQAASKRVEAEELSRPPTPPTKTAAKRRARAGPKKPAKKRATRGRKKMVEEEDEDDMDDDAWHSSDNDE